MSYLVQQLWATLLIAFCIGAAFGWLLKSWLALRLRVALKDAVVRQDALQGETSKLRDELNQVRERLRSTEAELKTARERAASLEHATSTAVAVEAAIAPADHLLQAQLSASQERVAALQAQSVETGATLAARLAEVAAQQVEIERLRSAQQQQLRERVALETAAQQSREIARALEQQKAQLARALAESQASVPPSVDPALTDALLQARNQHAAAERELERVRAQLAQTQLQLSDLQQLLPTTAPTLATPQVQSGAEAVDNLQLIRGVGPKIELRLRELGVYSFRQLARADAAELSRLAAALPGFASRIGREDWPGQCARLHRDKYGVAP